MSHAARSDHRGRWLAGIATLLAATIAWWWFGADSSQPGPGLTESAAPRTESSAPTHATAHGSPTSSGSDHHADQGSREPSVPGPRSTTRSKPYHLVGRCWSKQKGAPGVVVSLSRDPGPSHRERTLSDEDGRFVIVTENAPPWILSLEHAGSSTRLLIPEPARSGRRTIDIGDVGVDGGPTVRVEVRSDTGQPLEARIELAPVDDLFGRAAQHALTKVVFTDSSTGIAHVPEPVTWSCQVTIRAQGFRAESDHWTATEHGAFGEEPDHRKWEEDNGWVRVTLTPGTDVSGTVRFDARGGSLPLAGALVRLVRTDEKSASDLACRTDARGRFSIPGVDRTTYRLQVGDQREGLRPLLRVPLPRFDGPRFERNLILTTSRVARVRMLNGQGRGLPGTVTVRRFGERPFLRVSADATGRATIPIPPTLQTAPLRLVAEYPNHDSVYQAIHSTDPELTLRLRPHGRVAGRLIDPAGRPITGRRVSAAFGQRGLATTRRAATQTATDGTFELILPPGGWRIAAGGHLIAEHQSVPLESRIDLGTIQIETRGESSERRE